MPNQALADALRMKADAASMAPLAAEMSLSEPEICRCPKCGYEGPSDEFQQGDVSDGAE